MKGKKLWLERGKRALLFFTFTAFAFPALRAAITGETLKKIVYSWPSWIVIWAVGSVAFVAATEFVFYRREKKKPKKANESR